MKDKVEVVVSGSHGFLGREICHVLELAGYKVIRLSHTTLDYYKISDICDAIQGAEIMIHAGWAGTNREQRDDIRLQNLNFQVAQNLIEACKISQINHVIGLGSQAEFGNQSAPFNDHQSITPVSQYGIAKQSVLRKFENSGIKFTWARIFSAYGEGDERNWIFTRVIRALVNQESITIGSCSQFWSLTHKTDIALGIKWIIENNILGVLNLTTLEKRTLRSYLEELQCLAGQFDLIKFTQNLLPQNDLYPAEGKLHFSGWKPMITTDIGFQLCLQTNVTS